MKLIFIEDKKQDIKNWQESVKRQSFGVKWIEKLPNDITLECVNDSDCLDRYLENKYYSTDRIKKSIVELSKLLNANQIQHDLESILQCKFKTNTYQVVITTFSRAPFNLKECRFFIILRKDIKRMITTIYHELMHFLFYQNYYELCKNKGLSDSQINDFKEIITVLLNEILSKRNLPLDNGYPIHRELRAKVLQIKNNEKNFNNILEQIIASGMLNMPGGAARYRVY